MPTPLRVLILEDRPADAELMLYELNRTGFEPTWQRVDTESDYLARLDRTLDVVLADYVLPQFDAARALRLLQERALDIPFIVVSGTISEEVAVQCMKQGAADYLLKDRLSRLGPAVTHALHERRLREEKRQAEAALRESEARLRLLAENALDVIYRYRLAPTRGFEYVSPAAAAITGYTSEEFYADPDLVLKVIHPDDRGLIEQLSEEDLSEPIVVRNLRRNGTLIFTEQRVVPIYDEAGCLIAIEGIARDITERKRAEEQIRRAERLEMAGRVAGEVAHDINNLLGPVSGYAQLIKRRLPAGHPASAYCDKMLEAIRRLTDITQDLLTLGRRGRADQEPLDLNQVAAEAVEQMAPWPATLTLAVELAEEPLPIMGAHAQLIRALTNLLTNAREAMADTGRLVVRTEKVFVDEPIGLATQVVVGDYARLSVSDTGPGIPPEVRDKIFDAFFTTKRANRQHGSGLGLSVVQAIVDDHRGNIDVETEVGKGTTFRVYLPVI
ncbi:MAG: PAS domain S-box protein [Chloroflexi bacterium]|nr:PAS domain S-box protein [Chloroflexota bacterium]